MDITVIDDFIKILSPGNVLDLCTREKMEFYTVSINKCYADFIARVDNNYFELSANVHNSNYYLRKVVAKLRNHYDLLFEVDGETIYYRYEKSVIVVPVQKGNIRSEASNLQYYYLKNAIDHFNKQLSETQASFISQGNLDRGIISKQEIKREALGFRIKNPRNLLSAWRLLRENGFISNEVIYDLFENNFTGKRIKKKIIWVSIDKCLHYFINGIYGVKDKYGLGVEIEEDGQWNKASDCFCGGDGSSYDPGNLSRTKDPTNKGQIDNLNIIIARINRQPQGAKD